MDISEPDETCSSHKVIKSEPMPQPQQEWNVHPSISSLNNPISRFGSMNIDELFNNVWTDENQVLNQNIEPRNDENHEDQPEILPRQGSFKTIEEFFREINTNEPQLPSINLNSPTQAATFSEETLEEMTLEDFLVKARVLRKSRNSRPDQQKMVENFQAPGGNSSSNNNIQGDQLLTNVASNYGGSNWTGNGSGTIEGNLSDKFGEGNWNNSESDVTEPSNKRKTSTTSMEVAVERRQRRMIKNRESAARSRARKQVHISIMHDQYYLSLTI